MNCLLGVPEPQTTRGFPSSNHTQRSFKILDLKHLWIPGVVCHVIKLTPSDVSFVYEAWQHVTIFNIKVIMRSKHICGNHSCVTMTVLLEIRPVKHTHKHTESYFSYYWVNLHATRMELSPVTDINHSLCIGIAKVWLMRWTVMDLVWR